MRSSYKSEATKCFNPFEAISARRAVYTSSSEYRAASPRGSLLPVNHKSSGERFTQATPLRVRVAQFFTQVASHANSCRAQLIDKN